MNSYDKYAEDNYYQTDTRNFELEQLSDEIKSKVIEEISEEQLIFADGTEGIEAAADELFSKIKAEERKNTPVFSGVLKYFPNALKEVAKCSKAGNDQHGNGEKLFWDRSKSGDELDALSRHLIDHGVNPVDDDGQFHLAKVAWRALGALEKYLEGQDI